MFKPLLISAFLLTGAHTALADTATTYDFTGFNELDIAAGVEVNFTTAPDYSIVADFHRGGPDELKIRQEGERLYISRKMFTRERQGRKKHMQDFSSGMGRVF